MLRVMLRRRWMNRPYYFGAGPAALPEVVLRQVQEELLDWQGKGLSILELGHRTSDFVALMDRLEAHFRALLSIPSDYHVLFMGDPARSQFGMIPLNLLEEDEQAGYWVTGLWSQLALQEASKLKRAYCIASTEATGFREAFAETTWKLKDKTAYVYYTPNETVNGVRFAEPPCVGDIPLVADMTSCLLTEPLCVEAYGLIFAGAQKNLANAGLTVVIIADRVLKKIKQKKLPTMWDYRTWVESRSLFVTPPTFNCYVMLKVLEWVKEKGGVEYMYAQNLKKAQILYDYLEHSKCFINDIKKEARSFVNVPFRLRESLTSPNPCQKEAAFLAFARKRGLVGLEGHRTVGGLRASLYNAMPVEGVAALVECMHEFEEMYGC